MRIYIIYTPYRMKYQKLIVKFNMRIKKNDSKNHLRICLRYS